MRYVMSHIFLSSIPGLFANATSSATTESTPIKTQTQSSYGNKSRELWEPRNSFCFLASAWHRLYKVKKAYEMPLQDFLADTASGQVQIIYVAEGT